MRNSRSRTPKTNTVQDESVSNACKTSARKLRQARLPFKVIAPASSPVGSKTTPTTVGADRDEDTKKEDIQSSDSRKRKLSYDTEDDEANSITEEDNVSKENVEVLAAAAKKKRSSAVSNYETISDVVSLLDDGEDDDIGCSNETDNSSVVIAATKKDIDLKTPKSCAKYKNKGAGTPQTSSERKDKNGSATKLKIKLPLSAGKNKRRKSNLNKQSLNNSAAESNHLEQELSSDDIDEIAAELNPQKRKKVISKDEELKTTEAKCTVGQKQKIAVDPEPEPEEKYKFTEAKDSSRTLSGKEKLKTKCTKTSVKQSRKNKTQNTDKVEQSERKFSSKSTSEKPSSDSSISRVQEKSADNDVVEIEISDSSDENEEQKDDKEDLEESVLSDNDNEADDETDNLAAKSVKVLSDNENLKSNNTMQSQKDRSSPKKLTPKQVKLMEQRRKAREEKERKLQEEKMKKQQEKEEKEMSKKREREEKEELKRKEREEKEEQKRKDREEKERKRLADIEAKNEEKRKRNEAREEELRKKEEERKRKEHEKEELELKKKKAAQAFTKFFVPKTPTNVQLKNEDDSNTGDAIKLLAFRPFQIKGDMKLAPILRKHFTLEEKTCLDNLLGCKHKTDVENNEDQIDEEIVKLKILPKSQLYLSELRSGKILPSKWRRCSTESKEDVIFLEDELERVGQAIVEDTPAYVREEMRVKFYKFHDNRRPPYYGTWRKKSTVVKPRKPFGQDKKFFDYEVDSDDEWEEEEEPGESLEDGSDEDKEKDSEDDDYEVDNEWFVPHGHLSDEELQNEDEFGIGDDNTREAQKVKLQLLQQEFAQEMKKKTEKIKPRLIGCVWADINGNQPSECAKILWDTLEKKAMLFNDPLLIEEPEFDRSAEANSPSAVSNSNTEKAADKLKPICLSDNMIRDLTRLVHGNNHAKNFLINEYIAYIEKTEESVKSGGLRKPLKSVVRDKIDEMAEWQAIDVTASNIQDIEQAKDETNEKKKKKVKRRLCWVVKQEMLDKMDLSSLELKNSWTYTLPPKFAKAEKEIKKDEGAVKLTSESISASAEESVKEKISATPQITKLVNENITKRECTSSVCKSGTGTNSNVIAKSKEKKRVPLLISVARGEQISTPAKNKLISKFLEQKNKDSMKYLSPTTSTKRSNAVTSPNVEDDDVVILD